MRLFLIGLFFSVAGTGCSFEVETCVSDDDCLTGSECVWASGDFVCLYPDSFRPEDAGDDSSDSQNNLNNRNNRNNVNHNNDAGNDPSPNNQTTSCEVPLVDSSCQSDNFEPNNGPQQAEQLPGRIGCDDVGEEFTPSAWSVDATLCALESEDWFSFSFSRCIIRKKMVVEVTPERDCTGNEYFIDIPGFPCSDIARVSCERYPNGVRRTVVLLDKVGDFGDDVNDVEIGVVESIDTGEFEYHLTIQVTD